MTKEVENSTFIGRPKGSLNKRTERAIELISKSRLDPLEFDLAILNWDMKAIGLSEEEGKEIDVRTQIEMRQAASDSVKPYAYPKLKATEIKLDEDTQKGLKLAYADPRLKA